jgi:hypothetical protein
MWILPVIHFQAIKDSTTHERRTLHCVFVDHGGKAGFDEDIDDVKVFVRHSTVKLDVKCQKCPSVLVPRSLRVIVELGEKHTK